MFVLVPYTPRWDSMAVTSITRVWVDFRFERNWRLNNECEWWWMWRRKIWDIPSGYRYTLQLNQADLKLSGRWFLYHMMPQNKILNEIDFLIVNKPNLCGCGLRWPICAYIILVALQTIISPYPSFNFLFRIYKHRYCVFIHRFSSYKLTQLSIISWLI